MQTSAGRACHTFCTLARVFRGHWMIRNPYSSRPEHGWALQRQPSNPHRRTVGAGKASLSAVGGVETSNPALRSWMICDPTVRSACDLFVAFAQHHAAREMRRHGCHGLRSETHGQRQFGIATPYTAPLGHRPQLCTSGLGHTNTNLVAAFRVSQMVDHLSMTACGRGLGRAGKRRTE